jgi:deoxyribodipyrimidine photo-lyase
MYKNEGVVAVNPVPSPRQPIPQSLEEYAEKHSQIPDSIPGFELSPEKQEYAIKAYGAGEDIAHSKLQEFVKSRGSAYKTDRDFPSINGTSGMSTYLSAGVVSARECLRQARLQNGDALDKGNAGIVCWISELVWRDFYKNILVAYPRVCKNKPFKLNTDQIPWSYDEKLFNAWKDGNTGYPIVDAAMRQLKETVLISINLTVGMDAQQTPHDSRSIPYQRSLN